MTMNPADLRADIPVTTDSTYFNWGASGPSPREVVEAGRSTLETQEFEAPLEEGMYSMADDVYQEARRRVADLLGTEPKSIALTHSTTDGINRVATAIDWSAGDTIVGTDVEHSAGRLPWKRLERHEGVETNILETQQGRIDEGRLGEALDDAELFCFSAIDWIYGRYHSVKKFVEVAHDRDVPVLVDAVQVPGQRKFDVEAWGADFVAASGHKWLLGPWGSGFLYISESAIPGLEPAHIGYRSVKEPNAPEYELKPDASRFEVGTTNPAPYAGLDAAIRTMQSVGLDTIQERIADLTDRLKSGVPEARLRSPRDHQSGLVTLQIADPERVVETLQDESIRIRSLPLPDSIRVSVHAANTETEVDRLLDILADYWE